MHKLLIVSIGAFVLGIFTFHGCANHHGLGKSHEKQAEKVIEQLAKELELTSVQKQKLDDIKLQIVGKHKEKAGKYETLFQDLQLEIMKDKFEKDVLLGKLKATNAERDEMHEFIAARFSEFHATLTKEQKVKLTGKLSMLKNEFHSAE
ncbi:MAG: Spy/CpxP family protein refolding chaperone [Ignavibacteriales bacterium]|nr:Spy/CpxP family protein refolding chaperone [Ignavibacteriales bacterium]